MKTKLWKNHVQYRILGFSFKGKDLKTTQNSKIFYSDLSENTLLPFTKIIYVLRLVKKKKERAMWA